MSSTTSSPPNDALIDSPAATTSQAEGSRREGSTSLYLFTFLATLLLLLAISFSIVLRSYMLRRRYRQRLEAAIAQGLIPGGNGTVRRRRNFGRKPKLWDIWIEPSPSSHWRMVTPLSARRLRPEPREKLEEPVANTEDDVLDQVRLDRALRVVLGPGYQRSELSRPVPRKSRSLGTATPEKRPPTGLQLSVIISMPTPYRATTKEKQDLEEDEFPDVALGVVQLRYPSK